MAIVSCELPDPAMDAALKVPVEPSGNPVTVRFALELYPPCAVIVAVYVVVEPGCTD